MDQAVLVEGQIADGRKILDRLVAEGVPVTAASWVKEADSGQWYLYIATPLVGKDGALKPAYRRVNTVLDGMEPLVWIDPFAIKLIGAHDPATKAVLVWRDTQPGGRPVRLGARLFGGIPAEEIYIYPPLESPSAR
jgi:hypothetical protein